MKWLPKTLDLLKGIESGQYVPDSQVVFDEKEIFELARLLRRIRYAPSQLRKRLQQHGVTVAPASFYSEIPLVEEIEDSLARPNKLVLDELFDEKMLKNELAELDLYADEFDPPVENIDSTTFAWKGGPFSQCDAMAYYCFIRRHKPNTILEVGSGWSTLVATEALTRNGKGRLVSIEPFPSDFLRSIPNLELIVQRIQDLEANFFDQNLSDGDFLFIDSTHTVKHDSDCLHMYLRMLPNVQSSIFMHVHDVYLPGGLPLNYLRDKQIYWTEQYLLYAYMIDNPRVKILYGSQFHLLNDKGAMKIFMRGRFPPGGASLWISHSKRQSMDAVEGQNASEVQPTHATDAAPTAETNKRAEREGSVCPICGGTEFKMYNSRPLAQCSTCKSLERGRALWICMRKLGVPRNNDRILHMAPERFIMDRFGKAFGDRYVAADIFPHIYKHARVRVKKLDLCNDLVTIPDASYDFIMHNHVLEHLPCDVDVVLKQLARILRPSGTMLFSVPTRAIDHTVEDMSIDLSPEERRRKFAQEDHMRIFGRDAVQIFQLALGQDCFIPMERIFSKEEAEHANIPWNPEDEPTGSSIFRYLKA